MPLVSIKEFNVLIDNTTFFHRPIKTSMKRMKNLWKCQEIMTIQQQIY